VVQLVKESFGATRVRTHIGGKSRSAAAVDTKHLSFKTHSLSE
jgi:hypothetical protein